MIDGDNNGSMTMYGSIAIIALTGLASVSASAQTGNRHAYLAGALCANSGI